MSCGCGTLNCSCGGQVYVLPPCGTDCPPPTSNTFQNGNLAGVGVFDNLTNGLVTFRGIEGDGLTTTVTLDAGNKAVKIAVATASVSQRVFANAAARAAATPAFKGQIGVEQDTAQTFVSGSTATGDWRPYICCLGVSGQQMPGQTTIFTDAVDIFQFKLQTSDGSNFAAFGDNTTFSIFQGAFSQSGGQTNFSTVGGPFIVSDGGSNVFEMASDGSGASFNGTLSLEGGSLSFSSTMTLEIDGTPIPANRVLITSNSDNPSAMAISAFASTANLSTGWTVFANPATLKTCDTATVTLQQLAQIVGTLIETLKTPLIPHA